jgi:hypothetical protein
MLSAGGEGSRSLYEREPMNQHLLVPKLLFGNVLPAKLRFAPLPPPGTKRSFGKSVPKQEFGNEE